METTLPAAALRIQSLSKSYGHQPVLVDVTLEVPAGCVFGYLGANGAGKTTTLKVAAGLLRPTAGDVFIDGRSIVAEPLAAKARLGFLPESGALFEKLTPREYLELAATLYSLPTGEIPGRVALQLASFELGELADRRMGSFSKGQKQRVCWATALIHDPRVLLLDEPLNGLDVAAVTRVKALMREIARQGRTVLYSSHLIDVVENVCDRVAILHRGRILATGTVAEVIVGCGCDRLEQAVHRLTSN